MSEMEQEVAAFEVCLIDRDYQWDLTTIEYVRYDEKLYGALVNAGAVSTVGGKKATVSLNPGNLGRLLK